MSITSSDNYELHTDFADLLVHRAGLARWLSHAVYTESDIRAEELLPRFLEECRAQGVAESDYPFSAEDRGLASLRVYIQHEREQFPQSGESAQEQSTIVEGLVPRENLAREASAEPDSAEPQPEESEQKAGREEPAMDIAQALTLHIPTPSVSESIGPDSQENQGEAPQHAEGHNTADSTPVGTEQEAESKRDAEVAEEEDIAQRETVHVLVVSPDADQSRVGNTGDRTRSTPAEDIAQPEAARIPASSLSTDRGEAGMQASIKPAREEERALAEKETALMPVVTAEEEKSEDEERLEPTAQVAPLGRKPSKPLSKRGKQPRRPRTRRERLISWALLLIVLAAILIPAGVLVTFGISAYTTYRSLSNQAHSAVNHLMDVRTTFSSGSAGGSHLNGLLNSSRLQRAEQDFVASSRDFQQLQRQLKQSSTLQTITTYFPQYRQELISAQAASQIGIDVAAIGQIATSHAAQIAPNFSGSLLSPTGKPLITQPLLDTLSTTVDQVTPLLKDIQAQSQYVSLDTLPINPSERTQVGQLFTLLPQIVSDIGITRSLLNDAGWLLGVNQPRTFLVQTMDRAELRGAGGFTGQYGELTINGGRIAPFSLKDISLVEYTNTSVTQGQSAPTQYRSWWPFANWGLRDSNISADFPTTAQVAINLYKQETGNTVDGVISFTPTVIEHVLAVIGPIQVPGYNTTVNAQNLEDVLHYYQLDNSGIYKQIKNQPGDTSTSQRKRFTSLLTSLLMNKARTASADELLGIGHQVLADLKSKDLQIYFSDPATESVLERYGYAGQLDRSTTHDGEFVVQQNLSASKASQYVQTIQHDTVTLNSNGGATHMLQLRLVYNQAGPVYGYDTYYDYLRVYVPPSSQLLGGDGFSSGTPLCGGAYGSCPVNGPYPAGELSCPAGQYQPGAYPPTLTYPDGGTWEPLQTLGGPTNTTSDEPGRAMYGGWVVVPKNCTMTVTLSWYVPPMSSQPYSLLVQRQSGVFPELDLSILPDAANCTQLGSAGLHVNTVLTKDTSFALPVTHKSPTTKGKHCYPQLGA